MIRLQKCILTRLLSPSASTPVSPHHRLLSAAAPGAVSANPTFTVEEYLVGTCGLTRAQALKASATLSHLRSPTNPDAVLAFLADLGLSGSLIAALVAKDPKFLCAAVDTTLAPNVLALTGLGLSHTDIARLVSLVPVSFRCRSLVSNLPYYLSLFGSCENLLGALKHCPDNILSADPEWVKANVALLQECGLGARDIAKMCNLVPRLLSSKPERLQAMVACAEGLGARRGSEMFREVLQAVGSRSEESIAAQVECLKKTLSWSDAELRVAVCKAPMVLMRSKEMLQQWSRFLISEAGLEPAYIARRPTMLFLNLEDRLRPRYYALKFLKENGLLDCKQDYFDTVTMTEEVFVEKFIYPHKEAAPHLAQDFAATSRRQGSTNQLGGGGKVPTQGGDQGGGGKVPTRGDHRRRRQDYSGAARDTVRIRKDITSYYAARSCQSEEASGWS